MAHDMRPYLWMRFHPLDWLNLSFERSKGGALIAYVGPFAVGLVR